MPFADGSASAASTEPAFGLRDPNPLTRAEPNKVSLDSATIASTLNSSRPAAPVGSYTDAPMLRLTWRAVNSSAIGSDRASRWSLVTTKVSPRAEAAFFRDSV